VLTFLSFFAESRRETLFPPNQFRIQTNMILRTSHAIVTEAADLNAWQAFARTQQPGDNIIGCITQPAHAALAARLAAALNPGIFGALPPEVIDTIGRHDAGWAEPDLAALESSSEIQPQSFLSYTSEGTVHAWRKSIREAEAHSLVASILTSRHFCMLAPRDSDPHHNAFVDEENQRRTPQEAASPHSPDDLDRFTAALGFCDLLSLCLCSGFKGTVQMRLAHTADPASQDARKIAVSLSDKTICFSQSIMAAGAMVHVDGWLLSAPKALTIHRFQWTIAE
jgi:Protein of unknown function (DUF3891)